MHAELTVRAGGREPRRYVIRPGQVFLVGRGKNVNIKLADREVSRQHAMLELRREGLLLTDLGSRNGTHLRGNRIDSETPALVVSGDTIRFGSHKVVVQIDGAPVTPPARPPVAGGLCPSLFTSGEYEVTDELGSGGVGVVWAARQTLLDRDVAIKVFRPEASGEADSTSRERFLREGKLCQRVKSPYVVEVYDVRVVDGTPVIIMELVQGGSALDRLRSGPLQIYEALKICEEVARALEAAAAVGVVHRDVKPHNILIGADGLAKLSDFGIAKELGGSMLTVKGMGLGSLPYAAPEQVEDASEVDARTDIYGLGSTLYHLIAGRPLFPCEGVSLIDLVRCITGQEPVPLREHRPDCPDEVAELVHGMLDKDPAGRPGPAGHVAARLCELRVRNYPESLTQSDDEINFYETSDGVPTH